MNLQFPVKWQKIWILHPSLLVAETTTRWSPEAIGDCNWIINNTAFSFSHCVFVFKSLHLLQSLIPLLDSTSLSHNPSPPSITLLGSWQLWSADVVFYWRLMALLWLEDEARVNWHQVRDPRWMIIFQLKGILKRQWERERCPRPVTSDCLRLPLSMATGTVPFFFFSLVLVFSENHKWKSFGFITVFGVLWLELDVHAVLFQHQDIIVKAQQTCLSSLLFY